MIRPLRQFHYRTMITIGIVLPVAFVAGIAVRKAMPLRATPSLAAAFRDSEVQVWERNDLFSKAPAEVRLLHGPAWYAITFSTGRGFAKPDLLVYWVAGNSSVTDVLPDNALLLGSFNPSLTLQLPHDAESAGGTLVLYSLADHEIVDWSKPIPFNEAKP